MKNRGYNHRLMGFSLTYASIILIFIVSFIICDFRWVYTLDDPYIHLRVAENIVNHGGYGINPGEFSTPSSSIIWPFLLVPFIVLGIGDYGPLIINLLAAGFCINILYSGLKKFTEELTVVEGALLFTGIVFALNIPGLLFTGMEHLLHVLISLKLFYTIKNAEDTESDYRELVLALIITAGILVRYEMGFFILPVFIYLIVKKKYKAAIWVILLPLIPVIIAGYFFVSNGMSFLPNSIVLKSTVSDTSNILSNVFGSLDRALRPLATLVTISVIFLFLSRKSYKKKNNRFWIFFFTCTITIIATGYGIQFRYSPFIWSWLILLFIEVVDISHYRDKKVWGSLLIFGVAFISAFRSFPAGSILSPVASSNIYRQQYQMSRFIKEYLKEPVAINDIGLVSYENTHPILDLLGLGNPHIKRGKDINDNYLRELIRDKNITFVMIYHEFFPSLGEKYTHLGILMLNEYRRSPASKNVHFYTSDPAKKQYYYNKIREFSKTLPRNAEFVFD